MGYFAGVDLGTTFTAAAVYRDGHVEMVRLGGSETVIPSSVFLRGDGSITTGLVAEQQGDAEPHRLARGEQFKRRFASATPIGLGGTSTSPQLLFTWLLRWVVDFVSRQEAGAPARTAIAHPANWGPLKLEALEQAIAQAGVEGGLVVSEPVAAAVHYASLGRVRTGSLVAVYDLGGGTFDAAVLEKTDSGFEVRGTPQGIEHLGGVDFDETMLQLVAGHLGDALRDLDASEPVAAAAVRNLRAACVRAKHVLSTVPDATIAVTLPSGYRQVQVTRAEFEQAIRPTLAETVVALQRALDSAGVAAGDLSQVLLVGGSSRIPLVWSLVQSALGIDVAVDTDPKNAIAKGAALFAAETQPASVVPPPPPAPPSPELEPEPEPEPEPKPAPEPESEPEPVAEPALGERAAAAIVAVPVWAWVALALGGLVALVAWAGLRPDPDVGSAATTAAVLTTVAEVVPATTAPHETAPPTTVAPTTTAPPVTTTTSSTTTTTIALPLPVTEVAAIDVSAVGEAVALAFGEGGAWVLGPQAVGRIDPATNQLTDTVAVGCCMGSEAAITTGEGAVWVARANEIIRIDPVSGTLTQRIDVNNDRIRSIAAGFGAVWVPTNDEVTIVEGVTAAGALTRIDATTLESEPLDAGGRPFYVVAGDEAIYVASATGVKRIDPGGGPTFVNSTISPNAGIAFADGELWTARSGSVVSPLTVFDGERLELLRATNVPTRFATHLAVGLGSAWVGTDDLVFRVDVASNAVVEEIARGSSPLLSGVGTSIAIGDGSVWVATGDGENRKTVTRFDP